MPWLGLLFGLIVGFSLGLTGGGGAIFAVPLLVYGLSIPPRVAVGVSLGAVGLTALAGAISRWRSGQVEAPTGLLFAVAGMLGAPVGAWIANRLPEAVLLSAFAILMLIVAVRMWTKADAYPPACESSPDGPTCRRDAVGRLDLTTRCAALLAVTGVAVGILSGLFGVGGGFVIVPALVLFSGMPIHRAVATSLLVITLVSASGLAAHLLAGHALSWELVLLFGAGGVAGLLLGNQLGQRLSGPRLQRTFAAAIVVVALFVIGRTIMQ